jgi:8-oxo-dGTP diphosphatase
MHQQDTIATMESQTVVLEVDVVAFAVRGEARLDVLLVKRTQPPFAGSWALPGARLLPGERLAHAARRALVERTGLDIASLEQLYTFDDPSPERLRDPRGPPISVAYFALLPLTATTQAQAGRGVEELTWFPSHKTPSLAFDHRKILRVARERVAAKVEYAPLAFTILPDQFTMRELRHVHEALTGRRVSHENNFWRLMANHWNLEPTGRRVAGQGRPAALYRLPSRKRRSPLQDTPA